MADLAEILMIEHLAIKHSKWLVENHYDNDVFRNFHDYITECHIELEEKICFPVLESFPFMDSKQFTERTNRIKADHKIIDTLALNILKWHESGDDNFVLERKPLFYRLLVDHNSSEEVHIFPRWNQINSIEMKSSMKDALSIIESFGIGEYIDATGISPSAFRYFFGSYK